TLLTIKGPKQPNSRSALEARPEQEFDISHLVAAGGDAELDRSILTSVENIYRNELCMWLGASDVIERLELRPVAELRNRRQQATMNNGLILELDELTFEGGFEPVV